MRLTWPTAFALFLVSVAGCEARREADLLEVTGIDPSQLAPGQLVRVRGSGFPPGRSALIRLEGVVYRPGQSPEPASVEIEGRAVSAEEIEARFTRDALGELGGRGTLHGRAVAMFEAAHERGRVIGVSEELQIDIVTGNIRDAPGELTRRRAANELSEQLGLVLAEESSEQAGLPLGWVTTGSTAERAGLIVGDRIVAAEEVLVHDLADVLPLPGADTISLRLAREGEAAPFVVVLPIEAGARAGIQTPTARIALASLGWVLLVLLFLAPTAGFADWLARRGTWERPRARGWRPLWRRHRSDVPIMTIGLAAIASLPVIDAAGLLDAKLEGLLLGALALRAGAAWLATSSEPTRARILAVAVAAGGVAGVGIALGALAALGGTSDLGALAGQPAAPWRWTLLTTPVAGPALGLVLLCCTCAPRPRARRGARAVAFAIDDLVLLAFAAAATATVLGGWGRDAPEGLERLVRAVVFTSITMGAWLFLRRARKKPGATVLWASVALAALVVGGAAAQIALEPPRVLVEGVARLMGGAAVLLALSAIVRLLAGKLRREAVPLARFA